MTTNIPVLLDTDVGSDIDDALCLAYLLRQPRCQLLGITTVTGNTIQRAAIADWICREAGHTDVPIHAGATQPLTFGREKPPVQQYEAIANRKHRIDFPPNTAIEFLRQTIRAHPGELTLLAIGPMANVALLFAVDPEIPSLLKQLVLMCGVYTPGDSHGPGSQEYNSTTDPLAAAMVYRARPRDFLAIGLDVTAQCKLPANECRRRFAKAGGTSKIVSEMAEVWFRGKSQITFHDPLAGSVLFEPALCEYQTGEANVETLSPSLAGLTSWNPKAEPAPHRIAVKVDAAKLFQHFFEIVSE